MADTPQDTTVSDVPDVPVAAEADPLMDIFTDKEQDLSKAESSPAKQEANASEIKPDDAAKAEVAEPKEESPEEPKAETEDEGDVTPPASDETPAVEQPQGKAEERKQQLNTEIRDLVAKRNALKEQVTKVNSEVYQPETESELVEQGLSATDAKIEAIKQQLEMRDYNERLAEAQLTLESESQRVLNDFPIFNPESPDYNKEVAEQASELLQDALETDPNTGQVTGSKVSPYKLYKTLAAAQSVSSQAGQLKGQQAAEQMMARADTTAGAPPKQEAKDPILAILEDVDGY